MIPARALIAGESLVDIVEDAGSHRRYVGGSPLNVAYGLGRLGVRTDLLTRFGSDENGRLIREHLESAGVSLRPGSMVGGRTSTSTAVIDNDGTASYRFKLESSLPASLPSAGISVLHTGSIGALAEPGATRVRELFDHAPESCVRSYDPNIRPAVMPERSIALRAVEAFVRRANIVKMSDEDAAWLYPGRTPGDIGSEYVELGVAIVAVTRGEEGCYLRAGGIETELPAMSTRVVDTIGAGDAFMSGVLFAVLDGGLERRVIERRVDKSILDRVARTALLCAAITTSRAGAVPPTLNELHRIRVGETDVAD